MPCPFGLETVSVLDLEVANATIAEAADAVLRQLARGRPADGPLLCFTPNADHICRLERDPAFRAAYAEAHLCLPDGAPLLLAARLLGTPLRARVTGSDLLFALSPRCARERHALFLLGGREGVATRAARRLERAHPGLVVAGAFHGYFRDDEEALARIALAPAPLLVAALGSPRQELFLARHRRRLGAACAIAVGGAIDVAAGRLRRVPPAIGRLGLEWLWRLAQEPERLWRRYLLEDVRVFPLILRAVREARRAGR